MARSIFSYRLAALRRKRKLTQQEVAEALGLSRSAYTCYEVGNSMPTASMLCALGDFFDVSLDYLLGRHEDPELYNLGDVEFARGMMAMAEDYRLMNKQLRRNTQQAVALFAQTQRLSDGNEENEE